MPTVRELAMMLAIAGVTAPVAKEVPKWEPNIKCSPTEPKSKKKKRKK